MDRGITRLLRKAALWLCENMFAGLFLASSCSDFLRPPCAHAQATEQQVSGRKIKRRIEPTYPSLAKQYHLAGRVRIEVTVSMDGSVVRTRLVGGSPLLAGPRSMPLNNGNTSSEPKTRPKQSTSIFAPSRRGTIFPKSGDFHREARMTIVVDRREAQAEENGGQTESRALVKSQHAQ
jgi:hypothetical protein